MRRFINVVIVQLMLTWGASLYAQTEKEETDLAKIVAKTDKSEVLEGIKAIPKKERTLENKSYKRLQRKNKRKTNKEKRLLTRFIKRHSDSPLSLKVMQQLILSHEMDFKDLEVLYRRLDEKVKKDPIGEDIFQKLEIARNVRIGAIAPSFVSKTPSGDEISLEEVLEGKNLLLLHFWASWCEACRTEHSDLRKFYETNKEHGLGILSVSLDKRASTWTEAVAEDDLPWTHVSSLKLWADPVVQVYGVQTIPYYFLLDAGGKILVKGLRGEELLMWMKKYLD